MKVEESKYSIAELLDWYKRKELVVNTDYQRGGGLWPASPNSYFIDTILKEFPFPKVYFHERLIRRETDIQGCFLLGHRGVCSWALFAPQDRLYTRYPHDCRGTEITAFRS